MDTQVNKTEAEWRERLTPEQFKVLRVKSRPLPEGHDRTDRSSALRYTRETDVLTTGILYDVDRPTLVDEMSMIREKAMASRPNATKADLLRRF